MESTPSGYRWKPLDKEINRSAFSRKKETWYDRVLVFCSGSLPAEALPTVRRQRQRALSWKMVHIRWQSGWRAVQAGRPWRHRQHFRIEDGKAFAVITWGSSNYDYMKVEGEKLDLINTGGNSSFEIPVRVFDRKMPVIADTIAMSEPHEVEYTLVFDSTTIKRLNDETDKEINGNCRRRNPLWQQCVQAVSRQGGPGRPAVANNQFLGSSPDPVPEGWSGIKRTGGMELLYADQFSVDYYDGGYAMITIKDSGRYLVVPEGKSQPSGLPGDVAVIKAASGEYLLGGDLGHGPVLQPGWNRPDYTVRDRCFRLVHRGGKVSHGRWQDALCGQIQRAGL